MNNVEALVNLIERKCTRWLDVLADEPDGNTYHLGIALKASLLFELLIQECNQALLPYFPDRRDFAPPWYSANALSEDRKNRRRCLAENIALLQAFEEDIAQSRFEQASPEISNLGNQLRKSRNQFVHPYSCFCSEVSPDNFDLQDPEFSPKLKKFLQNLLTFCRTPLVISLCRFRFSGQNLELAEYFGVRE